MGEGTYGHMGSMLRRMKHCVRKAKFGPTFRPITKWNGDCNFEFLIHGK